MDEIKEWVNDLRVYGKCKEFAQPTRKIFVESADIIESLCKKLKTNGWIPCSERLPEEKINPITKDFYEYQVTFRSEDVTDVRHYKFGNGHWWKGPGIMDKYVTAWREPLEAYHG